MKESTNINGYFAYMLNNYIIPFGSEVVKRMGEL